jgi:hypothetical protein
MGRPAHEVIVERGVDPGWKEHGRNLRVVADPRRAGDNNVANPHGAAGGGEPRPVATQLTRRRPGRAEGRSSSQCGGSHGSRPHSVHSVGTPVTAPLGGAQLAAHLEDRMLLGAATSDTTSNTATTINGAGQEETPDPLTIHRTRDRSAPGKHLDDAPPRRRDPLVAPPALSAEGASGRNGFLPWPAVRP